MGIAAPRVYRLCGPETAGGVGRPDPYGGRRRAGGDPLAPPHPSCQFRCRGADREKKDPGLEDATITRAEVQVGQSRFDFLLKRGGRPFYLEVKSCTFVGRSIAMFPDAVTARGKRHMEELAAMSRRGIACGILFLVHWPHARFFLPDYHTDLEFARTFIDVRKDLVIKAMALTWRPISAFPGGPGGGHSLGHRRAGSEGLRQLYRDDPHTRECDDPGGEPG